MLSSRPAWLRLLEDLRTSCAELAVAFGEVFGPLRFAGMALILAGLAATLLPAGDL
jgi:hypothetical protein